MKPFETKLILFSLATGNIGGQIGLFMGFSLITVAEMLELIFLLVTRGRNLDERVKRHKKSEAAVQAALQA